MPVAEVGPLTFIFQISKYKLLFLSYFLSAFGMGRQYHYFAFVEFLDLCKQSQEDVYFRIWKEQGNGHFSSENTHKQTKLGIYMLEGSKNEISGCKTNSFCIYRHRTQKMYLCTSKSLLPKSVFCTFPKLYFYKVVSKSQNTLIAPSTLYLGHHES